MKWLKAYVNDTLTLNQTIAVIDSIVTHIIDKDGVSLKMITSVLHTNTTIPDVSWSVSPTTLSSISQKGMLTTKVNGIVTVMTKAYDDSGVTGSANITITNNETNVTEMSIIEHIIVFPIPAINGSFAIQGIENINEIEILDITGRKIKEYNNLDQSSIDIHLNDKGVYLIMFFAGKNYNYKKLIVD
jgi:hypothetical protein